MTGALALVLILLVAAFIVFPFLRQTEEGRADAGPANDELWTRERAVAVLAITEADFDLATGKLSDGDYQILRSDYEGRALHAMDEIEKLAPVPNAAGVVGYCAACGAPFLQPHAFCGSCGRPRSAS